MPAHKPNESIEGEKIRGNSRDPLRYLRNVKTNGKTCCLYKAAFNVFAKIEEALITGTPLLDTDTESNAGIDKIVPKPLTDVGESISCDTAIITSIERIKPSKESLVSNFTATHSTNTWEFRKQTNVKVVTPHQAIVNALQQRKVSFQSSAVIGSL